ncbi:MAG: hypothetical protein WCT04_00500 [Planctomycetota bacterium]
MMTIGVAPRTSTKATEQVQSGNNKALQFDTLFSNAVATSIPIDMEHNALNESSDPIMSNPKLNWTHGMFLKINTSTLPAPALLNPLDSQDAILNSIDSSPSSHLIHESDDTTTSNTPSLLKSASLIETDDESGVPVPVPNLIFTPAQPIVTPTLNSTTPATDERVSDVHEQADISESTTTSVSRESKARTKGMPHEHDTGHIGPDKTSGTDQTSQPGIASTVFTRAGQRQPVENSEPLTFNTIQLGIQSASKSITSDTSVSKDSDVSPRAITPAPEDTELQAGMDALRIQVVDSSHSANQLSNPPAIQTFVTPAHHELFSQSTLSHNQSIQVAPRLRSDSDLILPKTTLPTPIEIEPPNPVDQPDGFRSESEASNTDDSAQTFGPALHQNTPAAVFDSNTSRIDRAEDHPIIRQVFEALPKPLQPGSITIKSAEFGTIRIHISPPSDSVAGTGQRIQIRAVDPAARALLNDCVDHLRQKLQAESVHVFNPGPAERTPNPLGDKQQRRRSAQFEPEQQAEQRTDDEKAFWE